MVPNMPDASPETPVQTRPDIKIPREEILNLVGIPREVAQRLAQEESHDAQRLKLSRQYGQDVYEQLKQRQRVEIVKIGSGQFPIQPVETPAEFVEQATTTSREIKPTPPQDEIKEMLSGVAEKALLNEPKELDVAVACLNYVADDNLQGNANLIDKLKAAASTDHEKYELAKALDLVIPIAQVQAQSQIEQASPSIQSANKDSRFPFASFRKTRPDTTKTQQDLSGEPASEAVPQTQIVDAAAPSLNGQSQDLQQPVANEPKLRPVPPRAEPVLHLAQNLPEAA